MDWEQDYPLLVAPINRVLGFEAREAGYLHWWTFLGAYMEIGDCLFSQVVAIRKKKASGRKLDKSDEEFYRRNRKAVDLRVRRSHREDDLLSDWL